MAPVTLQMLLSMAELIIYHSSLGKGLSCNSTRVDEMVIKNLPYSQYWGEFIAFRRVVAGRVNMEVTVQRREES